MSAFGLILALLAGAALWGLVSGGVEIRRHARGRRAKSQTAARGRQSEATS